MTEKFVCQCKRCIESHKFFEIIEKLPAEDKQWMYELYEQFDGERLDAEVNECIINGTWPTADEQIMHARSKVVVFEYPKET